MTRIDQWLKATKADKYAKVASLPAMERYLETGDPKALAQVKPSGQNYVWWRYSLTAALRPPDAWEDDDRRAVHVLWVAHQREHFWQWLDRHIEREKDGQDLHGIARRELGAAGARESSLLDHTLRHVRALTRGDAQAGAGKRPTSAGRWLLSLKPDTLRAKLAHLTTSHRLEQITELITAAAPERAADLADLLLSPGGTPQPDPAVVAALLKSGGAKFEPNVLAVYEKAKGNWHRFQAARALVAHDGQKFCELAFPAAVACLHGASSSSNADEAASFLVEHYGERSVLPLVQHFGSGEWTSHTADDILNAAVSALKAEAVPVVLAALDAVRKRQAAAARSTKKPDWNAAWEARRAAGVSQLAVGHLIALNDAGGSHDGRILDEIRGGLTLPDAESAVGFLRLAAKWDMTRLEGDVWGVLRHTSKPVREAAARALAKLGDAAVPRAAELLRDKKADVRTAAVTLLAAAGTEAALAAIEARLDDEANDDVRDGMLLGLAAAWERQGRQITRKDVEARVAKAAKAGKLAKPVAPWADPAKLPPLKWGEGGKPLGRDAAAYLLYRQSRAKEIRPDVEAAPLYKLIDRAGSGEFARAVLRGFLGSKQAAADRWALAVAGLLGDDRLVPELASQVRDWVDHNRGKLAEYAVQALALLGSDAALLAVDAMAIRYRNKMKNVGKAAAEAFAGAAAHLGISTEELGDRVVPWLGFEPGKPRVIEAGKTKIEASIGPDLKLAFRDVEKNKPVKSLPKTAPADVLAEFKEASANLREIVKAQVLRLENLLVRQRRWPARRWKELFLQHPLLLPFASRLVWGHYDDAGTNRLGTFRALMDRSLTTREDEAYEVDDSGVVGMIHPLELSEDERLAWRNHLSDYEVTPPFSQLEREVVAPTPGQAAVRVYRDLAGTSINAMTFKGRAERLGWYRGSVIDAGGISSYYKSFPAAGVDVFLGTDDFYIGIDMDSDMKLGDVTFVRHASVQTGSYTYDEPAGEHDLRVVPLGEAPAIVFSEAMGDLQKIAGKKQPAEGEPE